MYNFCTLSLKAAALRAKKSEQEVQKSASPTLESQNKRHEIRYGHQFLFFFFLLFWHIFLCFFLSFGLFEMLFGETEGRLTLYLLSEMKRETGKLVHHQASLLWAKDHSRQLF